MERTVTTTGVGTASAVPDAVSLTVAVRHRADSVADALAGCASAVESLVVTARDVTSPDHVATTGFDLGQHHDRNGRPEGFVASHTLSVLCPSFDAAGELLTVLADELGERFAVHGVRPTLTDTAALETQARELAFSAARAKAEELAGYARQRVVEAVRVVEGRGDVPFDGRTQLMAESARGGTRFEPGTTAVSAAVTVTWRTETA